MGEGRDLQSLVGYQLKRVHMLFAAEAGKALADLNITPAKLAALLYIRDNTGCDQSALGRALSVNRSSAMKLVDILEELQLIERQPGRDLRSNALQLTAHGQARVKLMLSKLRGSDERVAGELSSGEIDQLLGLLRKLRGHQTETEAMAPIPASSAGTRASLP